MEPLDWEDEFRPLDEERIDYLVQVASELVKIAKRPGLGHNDSSMVGVASYQILRLTAMATAGFTMYQELRIVADNMAAELGALTNLLDTTGDRLGPELAESVNRFRGHVDHMNLLFSELG